jgi:Lar family restriction alleviation protein
MTAPDLKPCPFCGGEAEINPLALETSDFNVACFSGECPVEPQTRGETKAEAIAAWNTRAVDPAAIREAALREAAAVAEALAVKWWRGYKDRLSPHCADPQYQGMSDGADDVATAILALIGEKE